MDCGALFAGQYKEDEMTEIEKEPRHELAREVEPQHGDLFAQCRRPDSVAR
jgi:hypothetical protein